MIFLLFIIQQPIDFEDLFSKATTSLVQFTTVKDTAFERIVEIGQDTLSRDTIVDFLVSKFDTKSARERHTLKDIFIKIGSSAITGIVRNLDYRGSDRESRSLSQSLWVLGEIGNEEIIDHVARFIDDEQWHIRSGAYTALGKTKSAKALPYILKGLNDSVAVVRKSAYYALSHIATGNEIAVLIDGLDDEFYGVRNAAVKGLLHVGNEACEALMHTVTHNTEEDYFIAQILSRFSECAITQEQIIHYTREKNAPARLAIYKECHDKNLLILFLESENNRLLRSFITKKIPNSN
jgi:HEAT repeat protein